MVFDREPNLRDEIREPAKPTLAKAWTVSSIGRFVRRLRAGRWRVCTAAWRAEEASVALSEAEQVATMKGSPSSAVVVGRRLLRPTQWFMWARRNTSEAAPFFSTRASTMEPSSRTPEGTPNHCPVCGHSVWMEPSLPTRDAPCPYCGCLLQFASIEEEMEPEAGPPTRAGKELLRPARERPAGKKPKRVSVGGKSTKRRPWHR